MIQKTSLLLFALFTCIHLLAQQADAVVFTVNGKPVHKSEVERAYHSNDNIQAENMTVKQFVEIYITFKLNVEEAKAQGLDTTANYRREYSSNKIQLGNIYQSHPSVENNVVAMIYERMQTDVEINQAFLAFDKDSLLPSDTLALYKKALALKTEIDKKGFEGKGFVDYTTITGMVLDRSTHNGHMGWVMASIMPMSVEDAIYSLPINKVSDPIRSDNGYHIIQVLNKRPALGMVGLEQVMMPFKNIPSRQQQQKEMLKLMAAAYEKALTPDGWAALCQEYGTTDNTGNFICGFGVHAQDAQLPPSFMSAAFALETVGDVSQPVLTDYGYHLIRLAQKIPFPTFSKVEDALRRKVKFSERSEYIANALYRKQSADFGLSVNKAALDKIRLIANTTQPTSASFANQITNPDDVLFNIDGKTNYQVKDFANYLRTQVKSTQASDSPIMVESEQFNSNKLSTDILSDYLRSYILAAISAYENEILEIRYPEFAAQLSILSESILLYDVKYKNIWGKKLSDKELAEYYKQNKQKYGKANFEDVQQQVRADYRNQLEVDWTSYLHKKYTVKIDESVLKTIQ